MQGTPFGQRDFRIYRSSLYQYFFYSSDMAFVPVEERPRNKFAIYHPDGGGRPFLADLRNSLGFTIGNYCQYRGNGIKCNDANG